MRSESEPRRWTHEIGAFRLVAFEWAPDDVRWEVIVDKRRTASLRNGDAISLPAAQLAAEEAFTELLNDAIRVFTDTVRPMFVLLAESEITAEGAALIREFIERTRGGSGITGAPSVSFLPLDAGRLTPELLASLLAEERESLGLDRHLAGSIAAAVAAGAKGLADEDIAGFRQALDRICKRIGPADVTGRPRTADEWANDLIGHPDADFVKDMLDRLPPDLMPAVLEKVRERLTRARHLKFVLMHRMSEESSP